MRRLAPAAALLVLTAMLAIPDSAGAAATCRGRRATIEGTAGADLLIGTPGPDVIAGLDGDDRIEGRGGPDVICGGTGADVLVGGAGRDLLSGDAGRDRLMGGAGTDKLIGGQGKDVLRGGRDADLLKGGGQADRLFGLAGADLLRGGSGKDRADGGPGLDGCTAETSLHCGVATAPACHAEYPGCFTPGGPLDLPIVVSETDGVARAMAPVTGGIPLPRSAGISDPEDLSLLGPSGDPVPVQIIPTARWGGGPDDATRPLRWVLIDFQADVAAGGQQVFRLVEDGRAAPAPPPLAVAQTADEVAIDTGEAQFTIDLDDGGLLGPDMESATFGRLLRGTAPAYSTTGPVEVEIVEAGSMRAVVHVAGSFRSGSGEAWLDYTARYWFHAGSSLVRLFFTVENNHPCPLDGGGQISCHDVLSEGARAVTEIELVIPADLGGSLRYRLAGERRDEAGALSGAVRLYQDSSGTGSWDLYADFTDWDGDRVDTEPRLQAGVVFRGYRATLDGARIGHGDHAPGVATVTGSGGAWSVAVTDFWESFPKSLEIGSDGSIGIGLFPDRASADPGYHLRAGEHKTHEIRMAPGDAVLVAEPLVMAAPAAWYLASGALPATALPDTWPEYEEDVAAQLDTAPQYRNWMDWYPNLPTAIEQTDYYGLIDYGDWPIDYEGFGVAAFNLKYDSGEGAWLQWLRGGDARWYELASAGNRHLADIDVLHTLHEPRHWSDGVVFGHSYHDEEGFDNPHRNYGGTHPDTMSGLSGLLLTYYLTGYEKAWESALEIADAIEYRLGNDAHLCDQLAGCSGEGYALEAGIHDDGERPAAHALMIAAEAYRATGDERYRRVADALVEWSAADGQPYLGGPGTAEYVKPWQLSLYLRSLARFVEMSAEFGELGRTTAYESYLGYADWLLEDVLLDLDPVASGPRAAFPYQWWSGGAAANLEPDINNWLLVASDALAYAHRISGNAGYLDAAERLFRTGTHDPWFEGDDNTYSSTKETANGITFGHAFLSEWADR